MAASRSGAVVLALATVLGASCGGGEPDSIPADARYGISISQPEGWDARIARGLVVAETANARVRLFETALENRSPPTDIGAYSALDGPLQFAAGDFRAQDNQAIATRSFRLSERLFVAFVETSSLPPPSETLRELNELLASLEVAPGDFYPGFVEAPRFVPRPGWHVGTSGPEETDADGEYMTAWASTRPYADDWNEFPPHDTLERLRPGDGVIRVQLARTNRLGPPEEAVERPFRLDAFERSGFEGVPELPLYRLFGRVGPDMQLELNVFFGGDPTPAMRAEAEAMLAGLELPDWGPWELEP
jgi:hypothetical protein